MSKETLKQTPEKPKFRFFEIYVPGKHGYSAYFKTLKPLKFPDRSDGLYEMLEPEEEEKIIELAVEAGRIDASDAQVVKYVCELALQEAVDRHILGVSEI